jgi:hypothetical protein
VLAAREYSLKAPREDSMRELLCLDATDCISLISSFASEEESTSLMLSCSSSRAGAG